MLTVYDIHDFLQNAIKVFEPYIFYSFTLMIAVAVAINVYRLFVGRFNL